MSSYLSAGLPSQSTPLAVHLLDQGRRPVGIRNHPHEQCTSSCKSPPANTAPSHFGSTNHWRHTLLQPHCSWILSFASWPFILHAVPPGIILRIVTHDSCITHPACSIIFSWIMWQYTKWLRGYLFAKNSGYLRILFITVWYESGQLLHENSVSISTEKHANHSMKTI